MEQESRFAWWTGLYALDSALPTRWLVWADSVDGSETINGWVSSHPTLKGWANDELVNPLSGRATDEMQAAMVALAQHGSAEAGLALLVQLRPGLVRLANTAARWDWIMAHDVREETQATFFEVLFRHNLQRRPNRIAANLLLDTRQRLWRRHPRSGPPTVPQSDHLTGQSSIRASWVDELEVWLHLRDGVRELPGSDASRRLTATMAYRSWIQDEPTTTIASDLGVAPQTVSTRLYRLRRILRSSW